MRTSEEKPYDTRVIVGNLGLDVGLCHFVDLLIGKQSDGFQYIGVGNGTAATTTTMTGLIGTSLYYKGMSLGYPQIATYPLQYIRFLTDMEPAEANFDWNEFTVANGNSDAADNLNRKVSDQGTKVSGQTWTLDLAITFS